MQLTLPTMLLTITLWACSGLAQEKSILDSAKGMEGLATFIQAVEKAGLAEVLSGEDAFTVFAPNDEAFKALGDLDDFSKDKLARVLKNHVCKGKTNLGKALGTGKITTILGTEHAVGIEGVGIKVGKAGFKKANEECRNGYLNIIDTVLLPASRSFEDIAKEHDAAKIFAVIEKAGLSDTINGPGPFTFFAPTDAALKDAGELPQEDLVDILKNHIVSGKIDAGTLLDDKAKIETLGGKPLIGKLVDGAIQVNGKKIVQQGLAADNGVMFVIEGVLVPKKMKPSDHAADLVKQSIGIGSALYNGHNPRAATNVYKLTMHALLNLNPSALPASLPETINEAMKAAEEEKTPAKKAWALRKGLDAAFKLLTLGS